MEQLKGTIAAIWAIFLGILFWPIVAFYNYGALAWILNAIWLVIVGFVWIKIRSYRRAARTQNMGANHGQQQI